MKGMVDILYLNLLKIRESRGEEERRKEEGMGFRGNRNRKRNRGRKKRGDRKGKEEMKGGGGDGERDY